MSEEKKNDILEEKLDESELDAVSGGGHLFGSPGACGCKGVWFEGKCNATVERWSLCRSNDFCNENECRYKMA